MSQDPVAVEAVGSTAKTTMWRNSTLKLTLSVLSLFLCMEGGGRILFSINRLHRFVSGYDNSSYRLQWIALHRIHAEWTGVYAAYHPTRGWALKPSIKDMSVFDRKVLNSNSKGIRGKTEYDYQRTPQRKRILVLGDSFTFGSEVSDNDTYSERLKSLLPNTEVLNLGVQGYGTDQMLLYLKEEGVKYHPDIVLLGFTYLDIYRNLWTFFAYAKPKFRLGPDGLELTNVPVPTPDQILAEERYQSKGIDVLVILREKLFWNLGIKDREARPLTRAIFDDIVATTRGIGAVPIFVEMPVYDEIDDPNPSKTVREQFLYEYGQQQNIRCLLLRPRFRQEIQRGAKFNSHGHWNPEAHQVAAEEIKDLLLKDIKLGFSNTAGNTPH